jgi:hypothetical protein
MNVNHIEKTKFIPYQLTKQNCQIIQLKEKRFNNLNSIISEIEAKIVEQLKIKNKPQSILYLGQKVNNNKGLSSSQNNIKIGIDYSAKEKIKIKGYQGDKIFDFYNKIIERLQEFIEKVNEKIQDNIDSNNYVYEKEDVKLQKSLIKIRSKLQPNCDGDKYKTSGFFSNAFSNEIKGTNASDILLQMYKDLEKCLTFILSIVKEYCTLSAIINKDTQSMIKLDTNILFVKDINYSENKKNYKQMNQQQLYQNQLALQQIELQKRIQLLQRGGISLKKRNFRRKTYKKQTQKKIKS